MTEEQQRDEERENLGLDDARARRNLRNGLIAMVVLVLMAIGLMLAVPSLNKVEHNILRMPIAVVLGAIGLEILSCVGYVVAFLWVFDRTPARFGARVALSELAFGAAVALGGAGSVAVGAWLLIEKGARPGRVAERSAVLFLLTSGINVITLAVAGLAAFTGLLPGRHSLLLTFVPGMVGVVVLVAFLSLPWFAEHLIADRFHGRAATWATATADTIRHTARLLFSFDWRLLGACGYLWFDIAVLWVCFRALGHQTPPITTIILAYQIGYLSNLIPIPGGIGVLDGSFIGLFILYGVHGTLATSATIVYHAISLWVPALWGSVAFILLRRSRHEPVHWRPARRPRERAAED